MKNYLSIILLLIFVPSVYSAQMVNYPEKASVVSNDKILIADSEAAGVSKLVKADAVKKFVEGSISISIIGDSLSQPGGFSDSWPDQLNEMTSQMGVPLQIFNYAVGGHTFYKALTELAHEGETKTQVQMVIDSNPDIVFVALGINDCIYVGGRTQVQIIQDGKNVYDAIKVAHPAAQIVLIRELPHNESLGYIPSTLVNENAVPASHQLITYDGQNNVRVNNSNFYNQAVSSASLAKHQMWGNVVSALDDYYDSAFTFNFWKMARLGTIVDVFHVDEFGHMWCSFAALEWLKENIADPALKTAIWNNTGGWLIDIDVFYSNVTTYTNYGNGKAIAQYRGVNLDQKMNTWFYKQRAINPFIGPKDAKGDRFFTGSFTGLEPNTRVYFGWSNLALVNPSVYKVADEHGNYLLQNTPINIGIAYNVGNHLCKFGFLLSDGTMDVYEELLTISELATFSGDIQTDVDLNTAHRQSTSNPHNVAGGRVGFSRTGSGTQTASANTWHNISLGTSLHSVGGGSYASYFQAPISGMYRLQASVRVENVNGSTTPWMSAGFLINGVPVSKPTLTRGAATSDFITLNAFTDRYMAAGHIAYLRFYQYGGSGAIAMLGDTEFSGALTTY